MEEIQGIATWLRENEHHVLNQVETLPSPTFRAEGRPFVSFSTNNYLALASSSRLIASARNGLEQYGVGNCESRMLGGNLEIYDALERKLANLKGTESAILFATGYLTNLGVLSTLPKLGQYARVYGYKARGLHSYCYFSDEYNHLSIREGIRMSGADRKTFRHCDLAHLETLLKDSQADTRIIVTDGVFSQDGDIADLPGLLKLAERYDALIYVDDAHGTGILGRNGSGISEHFGINSPRIIHMGTLSKAYGAIGGYVATDEALVKCLRLACSAYGFTSTLPPDQALAVSEAIDMVKDEPCRRDALWTNQRYFVDRMKDLPFQLVSTQTPIVPILIGNESDADRMAEKLQAANINVDAVKFPAVPFRKARLRVQLNAGHTRAQIDNLIDVLADTQKTAAATSPISSSARRHVEKPQMLAARERLSEYGSRTFRTIGAKISAHLSDAHDSAGFALSLIAVMTATLVTVDVLFDIPDLIFGYLPVIFYIARFFGTKSGLGATTFAALCAALFMYEPTLSIQVGDRADMLEIVNFCVVASLLSYFAGLPTRDSLKMKARGRQRK